MHVTSYMYVCSPIKLNVCLDTTNFKYWIHKMNPRIAWIDSIALVQFLAIEIQDITKASN